MTSIPFSKIPVKPQLYKDYIEGNPKLWKFYSGYHKEEKDFFRIVDRVIDHDYQRDKLVSVLKDINNIYGISPAVEANLQLLRNEDTVTVITGQQAGLYTGPLYTILKAISAIKIASHLSKMLHRPVVPLFWMESSDHDLAEVNHLYFPTAQGAYKYTYGKPDNPHQQSVGSISFGKDFEQFSEKLKKNLTNNDFYEAVTRLMDETYRPGVTYSQAFGKMLSHLLGRFGLIIVDAENTELKRLASPIIIRKLKERGRMNELMLEQSKELEKEDYERQIQIRSELLNLFILRDNNRVPLNVLGEVLGNGNADAIFEDKELMQFAEAHPERFSPKVSFRPIVQDFLFPTVAYVGGPSELAYFAQLKKVYEFFEIQMPIIWPRASASLIDGKIQRHFSKTGVVFEDIFRNYETVLSEILARNLEIDPESIFDNADIQLNQLMDWLRKELGIIDKSIIEQVDNPASKMEYQLRNLKGKTINILKTKEKNLVHSYETIVNYLYPNKKLQERVYNIVYFLSKYGFWLMDYLIENIDINNDEHQVLRIPS